MILPIAHLHLGTLKFHCLGNTKYCLPDQLTARLDQLVMLLNTLHNNHHTVADLEGTTGEHPTSKVPDPFVLIHKDFQQANVSRPLPPGS